MGLENKGYSDLITLELLRIVQDLDMKVTSSREECERHIQALKSLEQKIEELERIVLLTSKPWYKKLLGI